MTTTQLSPVTAIAWSPTRSGLIATIGKESPIVRLYDIQHASVGKMAEVCRQVCRCVNTVQRLVLQWDCYQLV